MFSTKIAGIGYHVPDRVVTNDELAALMDTSDEWIQERTGIQERRYAEKHKETTTTLGAKAALKAITNAGIDKEDIDFIIFATLSPDYYFPGCGVLLQRELGITNVAMGALDIRNQCSGFVYGLSVADQFVKTGMYKNVLLVGAEMHSMGLDFTTRGVMSRLSLVMAQARLSFNLLQNQIRVFLLPSCTVMALLQKN
ncbi:MAG: hypothetical protein R2795_10755 [Saprospiraceae bacterium]